MNKEKVYFELNDWVAGEHYPAEEPFLTWIGHDLTIYFNDEDYAKQYIDTLDNFYQI